MQANHVGGRLCQSCLRSNSAKLYYGGNSTRGDSFAGCHGGKANGNDLAAFPRIGVNIQLISQPN